MGIEPGQTTDGPSLPEESTSGHTPEESYTVGIDVEGYEGVELNGMARLVTVDAKSIAFLRGQVEHWRKQSEEAGRQLKIWRDALKSAQAQWGEPIAKAESGLPSSTGRGIKTDFVRKLIRERGEAGIAPREIKECARAEGVPLDGNFPYTTLAKLKNRGEIRESGGKYFQVVAASRHM